MFFNSIILIIFLFSCFIFIINNGLQNIVWFSKVIKHKLYNNFTQEKFDKLNDFILNNGGDIIEIKQQKKTGIWFLANRNYKISPLLFPLKSNTSYFSIPVNILDQIKIELVDIKENLFSTDYFFDNYPCLSISEDMQLLCNKKYGWIFGYENSIYSNRLMDCIFLIPFYIKEGTIFLETIFFNEDYSCKYFNNSGKIIILNILNSIFYNLKNNYHIIFSEKLFSKFLQKKINLQEYLSENKF
jgi:hypothetical protein